MSNETGCETQALSFPQCLISHKNQCLISKSVLQTINSSLSFVKLIKFHSQTIGIRTARHSKTRGQHGRCEEAFQRFFALFCVSFSTKRLLIILYGQCLTTQHSFLSSLIHSSTREKQCGWLIARSPEMENDKRNEKPAKEKKIERKIIEETLFCPLSQRQTLKHLNNVLNLMFDLLLSFVLLTLFVFHIFPRPTVAPFRFPSVIDCLPSLAIFFSFLALF